MKTSTARIALIAAILVAAAALIGACTAAPPPSGSGDTPPSTEASPEPEDTGGETGSEDSEGTTDSGDEGTAGETVFPDEPLLILEWSGYEVTEYPYLFPSFADKYTPTLDLVADYVFFADDAEALAKMQSGVEADLVHPCESWWGLYVENDLVQPIDTSRLEYWDQINPKLAEIGQFNGQQYFVPWDWGYESILVRSDLVAEVPDAWADLWDPQYAGKLMLFDAGQANYAITALALGYTDPWGSLSPEVVDEVKAKLIELKPNVLTYWTDYTQTYDMPATGEAWLTANAWQDAYGYLFTEGFEVEFIEPAEGRLGWTCGYGIGKNTQNLDLVYEFLNAATSPESSAALGNVYWYGGANTSSVDMVEDYIVEFMQLDEVDTLFDRTSFYQPLSEEDRQLIVSMWDEVKAAP